jgi:hypothetical protein
MQLGSILGVETYRDTALLAQGILAKTWQEQFTTFDIWVLTLAMVVTLLLVLVQVVVAVTRDKIRRRWQMIFLAIVFDGMVFVGLIMGQIRLHYIMLDVKAPRSVVIERINPVLLSVNWKTYDPEYAMVFWGYDPDHLDMSSMGVAGSIKARSHEVLLDTEPGRPIYLRILVGDEVYGVNVMRDGNPYGVEGSK